MSQKLLVSMLLLIVNINQYAWSNSLNMPAGVTAISRDVYQLHMTIFIICTVIALIVFGLMFYCIIKFRKTADRQAAHFHSSLKLEIIWSVIPLLILVAMAVPASKTLMAMHDTSKSELTIKITGSQWKWHYQYLQHDIDFLSQLTTPDAQIKN